MLAVKVIDAEVVNVAEQGSIVGEQSDVSETPSPSMSSKNLWGAPFPLDRFIVTMSPRVTGIVGFELFQ